MKKLFLIIISFFCTSHQIFTMYNPFCFASIMQGRAAALIAHVQYKAGYISSDDAIVTKHLHEEDMLRYTWFAPPQTLPVLPTKRSQDNNAIQLQRLDSKLTKISHVKNQLELISQNIPHVIEEDEKKPSSQLIVETIRMILDTADTNIVALKSIRDFDLSDESLIASVEDKKFEAWFHKHKQDKNLLSQLQEERKTTLKDVVSLIIDDRVLQSLENKIKEIQQAPQLDFSAHVIAQRHHKKEARQYVSAMGTYIIDLCACKSREDYVAMATGGLGLLGFMTLVSKNNSEVGKIASVGCGGVTFLAVKRLYYQYLYDNDMNIALDSTQANVAIAQSRLENLRRTLTAGLEGVRSNLKSEFYSFVQHEKIERKLRRAQKGILNLQNSHNTLQDCVTHGFEDVGKGQQEHMQEIMGVHDAINSIQLRIGDLSTDISRIQDSLTQLANKIQVSEYNLRAWLTSEGVARDAFQDEIFKKIEESGGVQLQILKNSQQQLVLAQEAEERRRARKQSTTTSSSHSKKKEEVVVKK